MDSIHENSRAIVMTEIVAMGGAERSCLALARWMHEAGLPCHFVLYQDTVGVERFASHPLPVVHLKPKMNPFHKVLALRSYFSNRTRAPQPLMSGYQTALHGTLAGLRGFHCLMHDTPSLFSDAQSRKSSIKKLRIAVSNRITAHGLRSGGQTIVTSQYLREESLRVFCVDAVIARMGGLTQAIEFRVRPAGNQLRMLSVSRIEPNKRIDWMVRALAMLEQPAQPLSAIADWRLDVAGKGSQLEAMRTLAKELGVADRIFFHGFVSDESLQTLYDDADLFLMPAVQGYGIPAIESLQRGIPVLLHRESGVSDILLNTPWATVMEGGEEAMLKALSKAIASVREGRQLDVPPPELPTEDSWAAEVARLCDWL
jgi:glycosyltransferase involved in cell wall biosynthesis